MILGNPFVSTTVSLFFQVLATSICLLEDYGELTYLVVDT